MCRTSGRTRSGLEGAWGHLFGTINTREKFVDHRLELALHEWARFKADHSRECRNCHSAASMDITKRSPAHRSRTSASCSHLRRPASIATKALHTSCRTCAAFPAGNRKGALIAWAGQNKMGCVARPRRSAQSNLGHPPERSEIRGIFMQGWRRYREDDHVHPRTHDARGNRALYRRRRSGDAVIKLEGHKANRIAQTTFAGLGTHQQKVGKSK